MVLLKINGLLGTNYYSLFAMESAVALSVSTFPEFNYTASTMEDCIEQAEETFGFSLSAFLSSSFPYADIPDAGIKEIFQQRVGRFCTGIYPIDKEYTISYLESIAVLDTLISAQNRFTAQLIPSTIASKTYNIYMSSNVRQGSPVFPFSTMAMGAGDYTYYSGADRIGSQASVTIPVMIFNPGSFNGASIVTGSKYYLASLILSWETYPSPNFRIRFQREGSSSLITIPLEFAGVDFIETDPDKIPNPYDPIGPSGPGGGDGDFDFESDPVPLPPLPSISSADTGFTRIFNPTLAQVKQLADYLWTDQNFLQTAWNKVKQVFENPISAIIAFNLIPVAVPDGGNVEFKLMYISTGVTMNTAANQFVDVECGTLEVQPCYGSALDYSPYTKISCFLPFVGTVTLNTDEVMGKTLQIRYRVDICSGACVAVIFVDGTVMYQFTGHCAINIPMNSADFSSYISALTAAAKIGLGAATGAGLIGAASAVPEVTQTTSQTTTRTTERNPETGRQIVTGTKTVERQGEETVTHASNSGLTPANVANTVGAVMGSKPYIERSGSFTGNSGYLGVRRPYLIIERPNLCMPSNYQALNGFPAMMTLPLSSCKGFTRVQQISLTKCTATNPEQAEILEFLKSGVYL